MLPIHRVASRLR